MVKNEAELKKRAEILGKLEEKRYICNHIINFDKL